MSEAPETATYQLACVRRKRRRDARLKITAHKMLLEIPKDLDEETENRYRRVSVALLQRVKKEGFPGTLYGVFQGKYDAIVLKHQGKDFLGYYNKEGYESDRAEFRNKLKGQMQEWMLQTGRLQPGENLTMERYLDLMEETGFGLEKEPEPCRIVLA